MAQGHLFLPAPQKPSVTLLTQSRSKLAEIDRNRPKSIWLLACSRHRA